jgi:sugar O-acyltransferase (sialic acid O-acetyltransferase NeuD family)
VSIPIIILGSGGHAKVLIDVLRIRDIKVVGITSIELQDINKKLNGINVIGNDEAIFRYSPESVHLVNGIGYTGKTEKRRELFDFFKGKGYSFAGVIHPSAVVSLDVQMDEGVQVMAGAVIQTGSKIKKNTIINTKVSVDHDCVIGSHVHLAPGVTISGGVQVADDVHIGAGATIIQEIRIGKKCLIGAGSLVLNDVKDGATVFGVPAREAKR